MYHASDGINAANCTHPRIEYASWHWISIRLIEMWMMRPILIPDVPAQAVPPKEDWDMVEEIVQMFDSEERRIWLRKFCGALADGVCPRGL